MCAHVRGFSHYIFFTSLTKCESCFYFKVYPGLTHKCRGAAGFYGRVGVRQKRDRGCSLRVRGLGTEAKGQPEI